MTTTPTAPEASTARLVSPPIYLCLAALAPGIHQRLDRLHDALTEPCSFDRCDELGQALDELAELLSNQINGIATGVAEIVIDLQHVVSTETIHQHIKDTTR